jgi:4-aminobutyrate aminotransferase
MGAVGFSVADFRRSWHAGERSELESDLIARDENVSFQQANSTPALLSIAGAQGIWIKDASGRKYYDFYGNNCHHIGYQHTAVVSAVEEQLKSLCFVPRGLTSAPSIELAEKLIDLYPDPASKVLLFPGGSAAVEIAIMIAKVHTRRYKTISFWGAFHGRSAGALSLSGSRSDRSPKIGPLVPGAIHAPPHYWFARHPGATKGDLISSGQRSLEVLEALFDSEPEIAALIGEPIRNGPYMPPEGYWSHVQRLCHRHGALLIFDDIPTGLGKTGRLFNCEHFKLVPDMTLLGKALGGAVVPLAAIIASSKLDTTADLNLGYFTHEKNALSAAAGLATLSVLVDNKLPERAESLGALVGERLKSMYEENSIIANIRYVGLMFAIEFFASTDGKDSKIVQDAYFALLRSGVLAMPPKGHAISFSIPLIISEEELLVALDIIGSTMADLSANASGAAKAFRP